MTAAAPSPNEGRRPLGEVLVARGIVTPEQLTAALDRQRSTGQPLGEIIVALGFAPGPIIAQALATQHGGLIKTEYGFATGWSSDDGPAPLAAPLSAPIDASVLAERDRTIAGLREWAEKAQAAIASRDEAIARLRAELAEQTTTATTAGDEEALEALRSELAAARTELQAANADHASTQAQLEERAREASRLEAALADLSEASASGDAELARMREALSNAKHELAERDNALEALRMESPALLETHAAEVARLEAALAELKEAAARSENELGAAQRTNVELERRLQNARSRSETLARRVAEQEEALAAAQAQPAAEPDRWASATTHYVLRRGAAGYDLAAHDGPPPAVGDIVDGQRVARVAPAGPGFDVPYVYLAD